MIQMLRDGYPGCPCFFGLTVVWFWLERPVLSDVLLGMETLDKFNWSTFGIANGWFQGNKSLNVVLPFRNFPKQAIGKR